MSTIVETFGPGESFVVELPSEKGLQITAEVGKSVESITDEFPNSKKVRLTSAGARALREILAGTWEPPVEASLREGMRSTQAHATSSAPRALPAPADDDDDETL